MGGMELEARAADALQALSVKDVLAQVQMIQHLMKEGMHDGEHYGVIPGTGSKPTLLKPGAEKLCFMFRLDPEYPEEKMRERWEPEGHYTVTATCVLYHIDSSKRIASGLGLCSTREEKYAYRTAERRCPDCGAQAIVRSVKKSAFFCIRDKGGCGSRIPFNSAKANELEGQDVGKKPNPSLPDSYNTVLKMACKRALIAAVLNGTAASDIFTQDLDDSDEAAAAVEPPTQAVASPDSAPEPLQGAEQGGGSSPPQRVEPSPDLLMTFGQYKGSRVGDLPLGYLRWLRGEPDAETPEAGWEPFVADDEYSGVLVEAARGAVERYEKDGAIANLNSVYANLLDHGSLPPGHDDWAGYLRWYLEGAYKIDLEQVNWRAALTTQQIREATVKLMEMEIPL